MVRRCSPWPSRTSGSAPSGLPRGPDGPPDGPIIRSGWKSWPIGVESFAGLGLVPAGSGAGGHTRRHPFRPRAAGVPQDQNERLRRITCPSPRKTPSCWKAPWSSHCPMPCSELSWRTDTRCWRTARGRCGCTVFASFRGTKSRWRSLLTTSTEVGSPIGTSRGRGRDREGSAKREADL